MVEIPQLRTIYAGRVSDLERPPPAGVRRLLRAPYLTRMERDTVDPSALRADLVARPVQEGDDGGDGGPSSSGWIAIGLGGAALIGLALALAAARARGRQT